MMMMLVVYVALTVCTVSVATGGCRTGQFYNGQQCLACSKCPPNQIIKSPCSAVGDVRCKPFREFINFNQLDVVEYDAVASEGRKADSVVKMEEIPTITKDEGEYWRNLAFALIGVLCALIVVATIIVLCACRKLHQTVALKQPEEDDYDDQENGYVVIRQIRHLPPPGGANARCISGPSPGSSFPPSSRHQKIPWLYRPKRRLLNEYVDDVFESEDSAGSRCSRKQPLTVIMERESEGNSVGDNV